MKKRSRRSSSSSSSSSSSLPRYSEFIPTARGGFCPYKNGKRQSRQVKLERHDQKTSNLKGKRFSVEVDVMIDLSRAFSKDPLGGREFLVCVAIGDKKVIRYFKVKLTDHNKKTMVVKNVTQMDVVQNRHRWDKEHIEEYVYSVQRFGKIKKVEQKRDYKNGGFAIREKLSIERMDEQGKFYGPLVVEHNSGPLPVAVKVIEVDKGGKAFEILGKIMTGVSILPFPGNAGVGLFGSLLSFASVFFDNDLEMQYYGSIVNPSAGVYTIQRGYFGDNKEIDISVELNLKDTIPQSVTSSTGYAITCSATICCDMDKIDGRNNYQGNTKKEKKEDPKCDKAIIVVWGYAVIEAEIRSHDQVGHVYCPFGFSLPRSNRFARCGDLNAVDNHVVFNSACKNYNVKFSPRSDQRYVRVNMEVVPFKNVELLNLKEAKVFAVARMNDKNLTEIRDGLIGVALSVPGFLNGTAGFIATLADLARTTIPKPTNIINAGDSLEDPLAKFSLEESKKVFPNNSGRSGEWVGFDDDFGTEVELKFKLHTSE